MAEVPSRFPRRRKYPHDRTREVFEAVKSGDVVLLKEVLRDMNSSERASVLESKIHLFSRPITPLLFASTLCRVSVVDILISRTNCAKKQRIDALELLGASLTIERFTLDQSRDIWEGFEYIKRGMEERFTDPSRPLLKQPMEPVEAYQNRKESQTLEELALIEGDMTAILMESLVIRERILGINNTALLAPIRNVADYYNDEVDISIAVGLYRHAMKISQSCNQSAISDLDKLTGLLCKKMWSPRLNDLLELVEQTVFEYEKQSVSVLLKRFSAQLSLQAIEGDTLLHMAVGFQSTDTVKLLLNEGFSVNTINNNGDTPLHSLVTNWGKSRYESHHLTDMLEVLLDGGAHHDFVNNDGKTPMDMAATDEVRMILSEKRKLELKCISARAVKKFGLPYLGMVPKTLEKYISMH